MKIVFKRDGYDYIYNDVKNQNTIFQTIMDYGQFGLTM